MRREALTVTLSLIATALVFAPTASAAPCPADGVDVPDTLRVSVHSDCTADVALFEGVVCAPPSVGRVHAEVGPVEVTAYYCDGGIRDWIEILA